MEKEMTMLPQKASNDEELREEIKKYFYNYNARRAGAKKLLGFGLIYFSHYLTLEPGEFHGELIDGLTDEDIELLEIIGFRGSSKSVWGSLIFPIWLALENNEKYPFIVPIADTLAQSSANMEAIRYELENNKLLINDYGKFKVFGPLESAPKLESEEEWQKQNILLANGVRIMGRTRGQKIRGIRHRQYRPRCVIVDDPESLEDVRYKERRDKTERYILGEVLPAMDENIRKFILIGNYLHNDAIMERMKPKMDKILEFPLIKDGEGPEIERCTWKAKFPTQEALNKKHKEMGEIPWQREMMLKIVPEEGAVIVPDDIHYYDEIPEEAKLGFNAHGVDLAISTNEAADYTAVVSGKAYRWEGRQRLCIVPGVVNRRMDFPEIMQTLWEISNRGGLYHFFVENVAFQKAAIDTMKMKQMIVTPMQPIADKRARLQVAAQFIKDGTILFPRTGCEALLSQLFGFGVEEHDDMVDALVYLILGTVAENIDLGKILWTN